MDWQLFALLIVVGALVIGFVYFDAKRRAGVKRERREQKLYEQATEQSRSTDGFDLDGVGQVRVFNNGEPVDESDVAQDLEQHLESDFDESVERKQEQIARAAQQQNNHIEPSLGESELDNEDLTDKLDDDVPVLDDALFEFDKQHLEKESAARRKVEAPAKSEQPEQTSLFDERNEPSIDAEPELIFSLFVVASQGKPFQGAELVQTLIDQGMRHGDMDIFHRHSQSTGRGPIQFSLANALEPGIFDLDDIDNLQTTGLALFMALPGPKSPEKAYDLMVKTAKAITEQLGGFVLDSSKSNFSKQIEAHHKQQIQEFERKQLLHKN